MYFGAARSCAREETYDATLIGCSGTKRRPRAGKPPSGRTTERLATAGMAVVICPTAPGCDLRGHHRRARGLTVGPSGEIPAIDGDQWVSNDPFLAPKLSQLPSILLPVSYRHHRITSRTQWGSRNLRLVLTPPTQFRGHLRFTHARSRRNSDFDLTPPIP
jgi:hypothetical protein